MKSLIFVVVMLATGAYAQETHKVMSCNSDMSVCVENGVVYQPNDLSATDKVIYNKVCVFNKIQNKEVWRCEVRPGLPKYEPKVAPVAIARQEVKSASEAVSAPKKNSVILHAGVAPVGLTSEQDGSDLLIRTKMGPAAGATYLRHLNDTYNVSGTVLTNKTGLVGIGVDF